MYENLYGEKADLIFDDFEHSYIDNATDPLSANAGGGYSRAYCFFTFRPFEL